MGPYAKFVGAKPKVLFSLPLVSTKNPVGVSDYVFKSFLSVHTCCTPLALTHARRRSFLFCFSPPLKGGIDGASARGGGHYD